MIHALAPIILPHELGLLRDLPPRAGASDHPGWARYDRSTLAYGAVHLPGRVRLYLPRTFNLRSLVHEAQVEIDGQPTGPPRHRTFRRFETLEVRWTGSAPSVLTLASERLGTLATFVSTGEHKRFRGKRVIYTTLRNERLEWIRDWLLFHQREHDANAALIANNASTDYTSDDLLAVMRAVPGYAVTEVLDAPLPWGPFHAEKGVDDAKFLQTTLLNLVRDRFFCGADGVLNVDIDEVVMRRGPRTAFEIAKRWGYATFPGRWHYSRATDRPLRHADHVMIDPSEKPCPTKYVYVPSSFLGQGCLSVHSLEKIGRRLFRTEELHFAHCRGISTSWKYDRARNVRKEFVNSSDALEAWTRTRDLDRRDPPI